MKEIIKNYFVTEDAQIYNKKGLHRKTYEHPNGYEIFPYWLDGKFKTTPVHRLVALAFIPNPMSKPCVNHIDGNKMNNHVTNLEWVTYSENTIHALVTGLKVPELGEDVHNSSISNLECHELCKMMVQGLRNKEIVEITGVSEHVVKSIRSGRTWSHISKEYVIPKRACSISETTAHWICKKLEQGLRNKEIVGLSTNPIVTKDVVTKIRNGRVHRDISQTYKF